MWTLVNVLLSILGAQMSATVTDKMHIMEQLAHVCPYETFCKTTNETKPSRGLLRGYQSCCTECSCDADCEHDCCFPKEGIGRYDTQTEQCIFLTKPQPKKINEDFYQSYYVVTEPPQSGCVNGTSYTPADDINNDDLIKSPWGEMFPVFSKKFYKIFYNRKVALCHGVLDVAAFTPYLDCKSRFKDNEPWSAQRFYHYTSNIENPQRFGHCIYEYFYRDNPKDIDSRKCYSKLISACPNFQFSAGSFERTMDLGDELRRACTSGLYSPFKGKQLFYINAFCAMCNWEIVLENLCRDTGQSKFRAYSSMIAIDKTAHAKDKHQQLVLVKPKERVACKHDVSLENCRSILCPTGYIKAKNGTCIWPFIDIWMSTCITYILKPKQRITIDELKSFTKYENHSFNPEWLTTPTPTFSVSDVVVIFERDSDHLVDQLAVVMEANDKGGENRSFFPLLLGMISSSLNMSWKANFKNRTVELSPSLVGQRYFEMVKDTTGTNYETRLTESLNPDYILIAGNEFYINKMFFCEQVELNEDEYSITFATKIITYEGKTAKKIGFNDEFVSIADDFHEISTRICVEDSELHIRTIDDARSLHTGQVITNSLIFFVVHIVH